MNANNDNKNFKCNESIYFSIENHACLYGRNPAIFVVIFSNSELLIVFFEPLYYRK